MSASLYWMHPRAFVPSQNRSVLPLYTTPELSLTVTGAPMISLRKPDGSRASFAAGAAVVAAPLGAGVDIFEGCFEPFGCDWLARVSVVFLVFLILLCRFVFEVVGVCWSRDVDGVSASARLGSSCWKGKLLHVISRRGSWTEFSESRGTRWTRCDTSQ
jgi:hypothetical protein